MPTQYYTATSLDGFIADTGHTLEWLLRLGNIEQTGFPEFFGGVGALAMGSTTYEWILRHLVRDPDAPEPWPYAQPAWVFTSRTLPTPEGADVRFVRGEVGPVHAAMTAAAQGKNVWVVGGGELAGQFYDRGLLDEIIVQVASVTLGAGSPLFPREVTDPPLRLVSVTAIGDAFAELRYQVPKPGTVAG